MPTRYTVYILESTSGRHTYVGFTTNLHQRLDAHNRGDVRSTAKRGPWKLRIAIVFPDKHRALALEPHLESHSGRAFTSKHF